MRSRRVFSALNAFLLPAGQLTPIFAGDWNIANGDIAVNAEGGGQTVTQGTQVDVPDDAPVITGSSDTNTVAINAEVGQTANVTFENLNIDASGEGNVYIELNGDNTLQGGDGHAGLETNNDGELTASDANNNGSLTAAGIGARPATSPSAATTYFGGETGHIVIRANKRLLE